MIFCFSWFVDKEATVGKYNQTNGIHYKEIFREVVLCLKKKSIIGSQMGSRENKIHDKDFKLRPKRSWEQEVEQKASKSVNRNDRNKRNNEKIE